MYRLARKPTGKKRVEENANVSWDTDNHACTGL